MNSPNIYQITAYLEYLVTMVNRTYVIGKYKT